MPGYGVSPEVSEHSGDAEALFTAGQHIEEAIAGEGLTSYQVSASTGQCEYDVKNEYGIVLGNIIFRKPDNRMLISFHQTGEVSDTIEVSNIDEIPGMVRQRIESWKR